MDVYGKIVEKLIEIYHHSPRFFLVTTLASGILLFVDSTTLDTIGLGNLGEQYKSIIGVVFLISILFLISFPVGNLAQLSSSWIQQKYKTRSTIRRLKRWLNHLTPEQRVTLQLYIQKGTRTLKLDADDGAIRELERAGILYKPTGYIDPGFYCSFNINPWVFDYLKKHSELISLE